MATPEEQIADALDNPKKMSGEGISVEEHSIPDQIEGAKFVAGRRTGRPCHGLRRTFTKPPGGA